ncbi:hypothetical protein BS78_01G052600 [Paspalum vaginatum]|nr:hypothetical protein BS78_01G052600 [Paspalum vaginatum]
MKPPRPVIQSQCPRRSLEDITNVCKNIRWSNSNNVLSEPELSTEDAAMTFKERNRKRLRGNYANLPKEKKEEKRAKARAPLEHITNTVNDEPTNVCKNIR